MMGGNIKVKSELGKGSEITIGLRFKTTSATKNRGVIQELNGFRALVADDNMDSCVSVEKMLRTIGLRPEWTTSGKEAVFRAKYATEQNDPFHVYIIDWLMPDMNGVEVVRRIRSEIGDEVPIIILTAYDWSDIEDEAREAGVTAFCAKPLFLSELYDVLQNSSKAGGIGGNEIIAPDTFKGRKVLLVEDVELNREIAETILQEAGIHVVCVGNGQKAVEYMSQPEADDIDLILMDIMMPVMDGIELCKRIKSDINLSHIPVILLTARTDTASKIAGLENGADVYIEKPVSVSYLYAQMVSLLENRNKLRCLFSEKPFTPINTLTETQADEKWFNRLNEIIQENISNTEFSVDQLTRSVNMSRTLLYAKVKAVTGLTPNEFIRLVRLRKAAEYLAGNEYKINEICYMVGFNSPSYFAKCFQNQFGVLPKDFINNTN